MPAESWVELLDLQVVVSVIVIIEAVFDQVKQVRTIIVLVVICARNHKRPSN